VWTSMLPGLWQVVAPPPLAQVRMLAAEASAVVYVEHPRRPHVETMSDFAAAALNELVGELGMSEQDIDVRHDVSAVPLHQSRDRTLDHVDIGLIHAGMVPELRSSEHELLTQVVSIGKLGVIACWNALFGQVSRDVDAADGWSARCRFHRTVHSMHAVVALADVGGDTARTAPAMATDRFMWSSCLPIRRCKPLGRVKYSAGGRRSVLMWRFICSRAATSSLR
jgi:hypothetical protein